MWNFEDEPRQLLTEAEISAGEKEDKGARRLPSNAAPPPESDRLTQLFAPVEERGRMPLTKERYVIRDNPHKVAWERQVRMFLRLLPLDPGRGHRFRGRRSAGRAARRRGVCRTAGGVDRAP